MAIIILFIVIVKLNMKFLPTNSIFSPILKDSMISDIMNLGKRFKGPTVPQCPQFPTDPPSINILPYHCRFPSQFHSILLNGCSANRQLLEVFQV